jgi:hypothetical protein
MTFDGDRAAGQCAVLASFFGDCLAGGGGVNIDHTSALAFDVALIVGNVGHLDGAGSRRRRDLQLAIGFSESSNMISGRLDA